MIIDFNNWIIIKELEGYQLICLHKQINILVDICFVVLEKYIL